MQSINELQLEVKTPHDELKSRDTSWTCDTCGVTKLTASKTDKIYSSCDAANDNASPEQSTQRQRISSESSSDNLSSEKQDEDEYEEVKTNPANGIVILSQYFQIVP